MTEQNSYQVIPLGGVGEIGSNMTQVKTIKGSIIIDIGILFPDESCFDINYLIPNLDALSEERPKHLIFTHGHEDHIGAVVHFVKKFPETSIYAGPFTIDLIQKKFKIEKISKKITLFDEDTTLDFCDFSIKPIHVNHSIPFTFGLYFTHKPTDSSFFFVSDFKVDFYSPYEKPFDFKKLIPLIKHPKKTALFIDSTNILNKGKTLSENDLIAPLEEIVQHRQSKRFFFTLFSSNIHRVQTIFNLAKKFDRKIHLIGRSVRFYIEVAKKNKLLDFSNDILVENDFSERTFFIVSGCQGEFKSSMRRISYGEDSKIEINTKDVFIFSSKAIPGNEKNIFKMYNKICESGAEVISSPQYQVHASGHPAQEDLRTLLSKLPRDLNYVPIHGESFLLEQHAQFISREFATFNVLKMTNFDRLSYHDEKGFSLEENQRSEPTLIHGKGLPIQREHIRERRKLAQSGLVLITRGPKVQPEVKSYGIPLFFIDFVLKDKRRLQSLDDESLRIHVRRLGTKHLGYKPVTVITTLSKKN